MNEEPMNPNQGDVPKGESVVDELRRLRREKGELQHQVQQVQFQRDQAQEELFESENEVRRLKGWIDHLTVSLDRTTSRLGRG